MNWYYLKNGQCIGPVPAGEIVRLVRVGRLTRNDRVRYGVRGPWMPVSKVPALRPAGHALPVAKPVTPRPPAPPPGYLAAHWRGQLPLARSFWFNTVLLGVSLSLALLATITGWLPVPAGISRWQLAALFAVLALLLLPWQFIGSWRSAECRQDIGDHAHAGAARLGLAIFAAQLFGLLTWSVPFYETALRPAPVVRAPAAPAPMAPAVRVAARASAPVPSAPVTEPTTAPPTTSAQTPDSALKRLETTEPFATLRRHAPREYQLAHNLVSQALDEGESQEAALARAAKLLPQLSERYLPRAPDQAISDYGAVLVREMEALQAKDPVLCARFAYPRSGETMRLAEHLDRSVLDAENAALTAVISRAAVQPQPVVEFKDVQEDLVGVYARVAARHGPQVYKLDQPYASGFNDAQLCQITIDIYAEFQRLPLAARGKLLRFTLGS